MELEVDGALFEGSSQQLHKNIEKNAQKKKKFDLKISHVKLGDP
jgi:hypothetical protein